MLKKYQAIFLRYQKYKKLAEYLTPERDITLSLKAPKHFSAEAPTKEYPQF